MTTLGSMCAASLLNEDTVLPFAGNLNKTYSPREDLTVGSEDTEKLLQIKQIIIATLFLF